MSRFQQKELENYFENFRKNIVGYNCSFTTCYGLKKLYYADWTASGRLYKQIESKISNEIGPFVGNTHSEASETGIRMTNAYNYAKSIIKNHVNANQDDSIILTGTGMTGAINKLQRIMGFKAPEKLYSRLAIDEKERPVVFVTHMEHHSNHTSWLETICEVVCIPPNDEGNVDLNKLRNYIEYYKDRRVKIGSFTACSNVTGIQTPYYEMAQIMHENGGVCFVDFSASAPYVNIDMHPKNKLQNIDAILFAPHKFLGGPGSSGVLIFDSKLYSNLCPDQPGGGTVKWTNPWGGHKYVDDIETREDGGTPGFLQAIKASLSIKLKEQMNVDKIYKREKYLAKLLLENLKNIRGLKILSENISERLGIVSFYIDNIHYNLIVKLLNDRYGIQTRGGCSCAGTYGHYLLNIDKETSKKITDRINTGDLSEKPGWVRVSIHPTMTESEVLYITNAISEISGNIKKWEKDYTYDRWTNEFKNIKEYEDADYIKKYFEL